MSEREGRIGQVNGSTPRHNLRFERRLRQRLPHLIGWLATGTLWGHGVRSLIGNPIFAVLPWVFLELYAVTLAPPMSWLWLSAFVLGYPHALYTALEIRHVLGTSDHIVGPRTLGQVTCFGGQALLGGVLAVWYTGYGAVVLAGRLGHDLHAMVAVLAVGGSVGAVVGLQDVLVVDVLLRPVRVVNAAMRALTHAQWLPVTVPTAIGQALLAELVLPLF